MAERKRPGLVTFAGIMMFMVAAFNLVFAVAAFANAPWLVEFRGAIDNNLQLFGIVDVLIAVGCAFAGYSILKGGKFGYYWAIAFALINGVKWFFMIPWQPFMSIVLISLAMVVVFALAVNPEWFGFAFMGEYSKPFDYE